MKVTFIESENLGVFQSAYEATYVQKTKKARASAVRRFIHALRALAQIDSSYVHYIGMGMIPTGAQGLIIVQDGNEPVQTGVTNA